jgi:Flp pilus assembly pilin Flp
LEGKLLVRFLRQLWGDEEAATAVEYAVMLALIFAAVVTSVMTFGGQAGTLFGQSNQNLNSHGFGS